MDFILVAAILLILSGPWLYTPSNPHPNRLKFAANDVWARLQRQGGRTSRQGIAITRKDVDYQFDYISEVNEYGGEGRPDILLSRPIQASEGPGGLPELPTMRLRRENALDRFGKLILLNKEVQTFDEDFDDKVYVECEAGGGAAARMLHSAAARRAVSRLLAMGFKQIELRRHGRDLFATWSAGTRRFDTRVISESIASMEALAEALPPCQRVPSTAQTRPGIRLLQALSVLSILSFRLYLLAPSHWLPLDDGLSSMRRLSATLLFLVLFVFSTAMVRGTSHAMRHLILCTALSGVTAATLGPGMVTAINGRADSEVATHERPLTRKRIDESGERPSYYFNFEDIPGVASPSLKLRVSAAEYRQAQPGDLYAIQLATAWRCGLPRHAVAQEDGEAVASAAPRPRAPRCRPGNLRIRLPP